MKNLRERLAHLVDHGDADGDAQKLEARELDDAAGALERRVDPYEGRTGPIRRAYRSPADGELHEFGLYVPPSFARATKKRWPLIVVLHGMNGRPMAMLRWFFGGDVKGKEQEWEDRHWILDDAKPGRPRRGPDAETARSTRSSSRRAATATRCTATSAKTTCFACSSGRGAPTPSIPIASRSPARRWGASAPRPSPSATPISSPPPRRSAATTATSCVATCRGDRCARGSACSPKSDRTWSGPRTARTCRCGSCTGRRISRKPTAASSSIATNSSGTR